MTPEEQLAEAKKAAEDAKKVADEAVAELAKLRKANADLTGKVMTPEQQKRLADLEAAAAATEEERKKKAGEWETLKTDLLTKHGNEIKERDEKIGKLSDLFKRTVVQAEFGRASDLFGGDTAKTILDVDLALAALGSYVHVEDDETDPRGYRVVVKKSNGTPIVGKDGNPAPFADAMTELIGSLPNKDRILRGSGKTGSGNSGGHGSGHHDKALDTPKTAKDFNDPKVREAVKQKHNAAGGIQSGAVFDRK